jgi:hypothetical protein
MNNATLHTADRTTHAVGSLVTIRNHVRPLSYQRLPQTATRTPAARSSAAC